MPGPQLTAIFLFPSYLPAPSPLIFLFVHLNFHLYIFAEIRYNINV